MARNNKNNYTSLEAQGAIEKYAKESEQRIAFKERFLKKTQAIHTPIEVEALWVALHESQRGDVELSDEDYTSLSYYERWTVIEGSDEIPTPFDFGARQIEITIPHFANKQIIGDFGHNEIRRIVVDEGSTFGLKAIKNRIHNTVRLYKDVEELRETHSIPDLIKLVEKLQVEHSRLDLSDEYTI